MLLLNKRSREFMAPCGSKNNWLGSFHGRLPFASFDSDRCVGSSHGWLGLLFASFDWDRCVDSFHGWLLFASFDWDRCMGSFTAGYPLPVSTRTAAWAVFTAGYSASFDSDCCVGSFHGRHYCRYEIRNLSLQNSFFILCSTCYNFQKLCILLTVCVDALPTVLIINSLYFSK